MIFLDPDLGERMDVAGYRRYLESVRDAMPEEVHRFASDMRHYDRSSPQSLHDAWLDSLVVREQASGDRREIRRLAVDIDLVGPFHDRRIRLRYRGVQAYRFDTERAEGARWTHTAHGDLLMHEVRLGEGGNVVHELRFERRGTFLIECESFSHVQETLPPVAR
jgi:hypothetical protein